MKNSLIRKVVIKPYVYIERLSPPNAEIHKHILIKTNIFMLNIYLGNIKQHPLCSHGKAVYLRSVGSVLVWMLLYWERVEWIELIMRVEISKQIKIDD